MRTPSALVAVPSTNDALAGALATLGGALAQPRLVAARIVSSTAKIGARIGSPPQRVPEERQLVGSLLHLGAHQVGAAVAGVLFDAEKGRAAAARVLNRRDELARVHRVDAIVAV